MKKLIVMAIATAVLYRVAKYFGIESWEDLTTKGVPGIKDLVFSKS